jgi:hypothetical protein
MGSCPRSPAENRFQSQLYGLGSSSFGLEGYPQDRLLLSLGNSRLLGNGSHGSIVQLRQITDDSPAMKSIRKLPTARQLANAPPPLARIVVDERSQTARIVIDREGWPKPGEPLVGGGGAHVAARALRCGKSDVVASYLNGLSSRKNIPPHDQEVLRIMANMLGPPSDCHEPFRFEMKHRTRGSSFNAERQFRLMIIGRHAVWRRDGSAKGKFKPAVHQTRIDLGVSESDVYKGLKLVEGRG